MLSGEEMALNWSFGEAGEVGALIRRIATEEEDVPGEARRRAVAVLGELDDVAVLVLRPRVGGVGAFIALRGTALRVVRHDHVDLAVDRVALDVLRAVHLGRAEQVTGATGVDKHVGLRGEPVRLRERPFAVDQRQPLAGPVLDERATKSVPSSSRFMLRHGRPGCKRRR